jgi:hypothetical protein
MKKYSLLYSILFSLLFSGCYFTFNAAMCDQIAQDPNAQIPQECRDYNEEDAEKAFNKTKNQTTSEDEDIIKFQKEEDKDK